MRIFIVILFLSVQVCFAQDKVEREYKIRPAQAPATALDFVKSSFDGIKVNWYMEQSANGRSVEAKAKKEGRLHSIEFDTLGNIQDIEVVINFKDIPEKLQTTISKELSTQFSRYKIRKVQRQWKGSAAALQALLHASPPQGAYETNYEIVITGRKNNHTDDFEVLFSQRGNLISVHKIIESNHQHLLF